MVLDLSRSLGLSVVAEGIETHAQAEALLGLGCPYGQGYIFSRPIIPERDAPLELPAELVKGRPIPASV
jgi:EAL domain-containing protein (putative c-di-GMP-specific phosphodiesterase class I)